MMNLENGGEREKIERKKKRGQVFLYILLAASFRVDEKSGFYKLRKEMGG